MRWGPDEPVHFVFLQLHVGHSDQLVQFALGLDDLRLPRGIGGALILALVNPIEWGTVSINGQSILVMLRWWWKVRSGSGWCYLTEAQMMVMRNTARKTDSRTPRMICSSLVNIPSTTWAGGKRIT